jgi:predicted nuclease of predicted toxin-antitoxin system
VSRLFISLYLDEDVAVLVATLLRARGFTAITTQEADQLGRSDPEQLTYATSQGSVLLTHNRADFEALAEQYFLAGQPHCGLIIAVRRPPYELARRLLTIIDNVTADEMDNQLRYI